MRATFRQRVGCRSACSPTWISAMPSVWGSCSGSAKRSWTCTGVSASTLPSSRGMAAGSCPFLSPSWSAMTAGSKPASSTPTSVTACGQRTRGSRARSLPGLSRCRHLLCQARRTGGTTPSLAKVFLPDPLAQALNSPVAIGGNAHVTRHNSDHHSDSDPARRHTYLGPQPGLGLRSVRHRRPDPDYPLDLAAAREDLAESWFRGIAGWLSRPATLVCQEPCRPACADLKARSEEEEKRQPIQQLPGEMGADFAPLDLVGVADRKVEGAERHRDGEDQCRPEDEGGSRMLRGRRAIPRRPPWRPAPADRRGCRSGNRTRW